MSKAYDFIIIGAGPLGCLSALHLHAQGWRVLLLEKNAWERLHPPYLNGLSEHFAPLWEHLGIQEFLRDCVFEANRGVEVVTRRGAKLQMEWEPGQGRAFWQRAPFDRALRQAIQQHGIQVYSQVQNLQPLWQGERIAGVKGYLQEQPFIESATWVIGCDGARSRWAEAVHLPASAPSFYRLYQGRVYYQTGFAPGKVSIFPEARQGRLILAFSSTHPEQGTYVEVETDMQQPSPLFKRYKAHLPEYFTETLRQHPQVIQRLHGAQAQEAWHHMTLQGQQRPAIQRPGTLLLGDAAACVDPLGSSGFWLGAQGLAELLEITRSSVPESWDWSQWEARYRQRVIELERFTRALRRLARSPLGMGWALRRLQKKPSQKKLIFDTLNGLQSYSDFFTFSQHWRAWRGRLAKSPPSATDFHLNSQPVREKVNGDIEIAP